MKKSKIVLMILFVAIAITSCTRSAAVSLVGTATPGKVATKANEVKGLNAIELAKTQTAVAMGTTNPSMPTLAVNGTPGTAVATTVSSTFPTPTGVSGTMPTLAAGVPTQTQTTGSQSPTSIPTQAAAATSVPVANPGSYVMQFGEYPYCLARRFNVNPDDLLRVNGLADGQGMQPGTVLTIPQGGSGFPGLRSLHPHPSTWTVDPGDTIYSIACWYGDVNPTSIAAVNGLTGDYELVVGSVLQIP